MAMDHWTLTDPVGQRCTHASDTSGRACSDCLYERATLLREALTKLELTLLVAGAA